MRPGTHETLRRKDGGNKTLGIRRSLVEQRTPRLGRQAQAKLITQRREEEARSLKTQHSKEVVGCLCSNDRVGVRDAILMTDGEGNLVSVLLAGFHRQHDIGVRMTAIEDLAGPVDRVTECPCACDGSIERFDGRPHLQAGEYSDSARRRRIIEWAEGAFRSRLTWRPVGRHARENIRPRASGGQPTDICEQACRISLQGERLKLVWIESDAAKLGAKLSDESISVHKK